MNWTDSDQRAYEERLAQIDREHAAALSQYEADKSMMRCTLATAVCCLILGFIAGIFV